MQAVLLDFKTGPMRQGQQNRRGRNRGGGGGGGVNNNGGGRKPQNSMSRNYESSGPDVKIRGTAMHIAEKYASLARDAMSSGDIVGAENYLQHAEHYNRIIMAAQAQNPPMQNQGGDVPHVINGGGRFNNNDGFQRDYNGNESDEGEDDEFAGQRPAFLERAPAYRQHHQQQPYMAQPPFPPNQDQPTIPSDPGSLPQPVEGAGEFIDGDRGPPKRRRRRPMGDGPRGFNGRNGATHGTGPNGSAPGNDNAPDEAAS